MGDSFDKEYNTTEAEEYYDMKIPCFTIAKGSNFPLPEEFFPKQQTQGAAGYDLVNNDFDFMLRPGEIRVVPTGVCWQLPPKKIGLVCSRSGLATKGILVVNAPGVIDSDYRGEIKVILGNIGEEPRTIRKFDRIAQMIIVHDSSTALYYVDELSPTARGEKGFGSTGA